MSELTWEIPPAGSLAGKATGSRSVIKSRLLMLDQRPGDWAVIRVYDTADVVGPICTKSNQKYPMYEFAFNGKKLYARRKPALKLGRQEAGAAEPTKPCPVCKK